MTDKKKRTDYKPELAKADEAVAPFKLAISRGLNPEPGLRVEIADENGATMVLQGGLGVRELKSWLAGYAAGINFGKQAKE